MTHSMLDSRNTNSTVRGEAQIPQDHQQQVGIKTNEVGTVTATVSTIEDLSLTGGSVALEREALDPRCQTWSYVHVHNKSVDRLEKDCHQFEDAPSECFVPRTPYTAVRKPGRTVREVSKTQLTVGGLVFFRGFPQDIQRYLRSHYGNLYLVKDSATGKPAVIPDSQMKPFQKMVQFEPSLVRIMDKPISYYVQGHKLVRVLTGILKGHEGYIVRKAGDRKLFMPFGNKTIAISNIHSEQFEEV